MKVIKINAIWCSACLVMNKIWNEIEKEKNIEIINLDYVMDEEEVKKYNPGEILPVMIFIDEKGNELKRLTGELKKDKIIELIEELGEK